MDKICPIMSPGINGMINCKGEKCAWWSKTHGTCIVFVVAIIA